ncbi:MAG: hypothetical protein WCT24_03165 [Patescibacteria group bacterium]|jgi:hypothetical protein
MFLRKKDYLMLFTVVLGMVIFIEPFIFVAAPHSYFAQVILLSYMTPSLVILAVYMGNPLPTLSVPVILNTIFLYVSLGLIVYYAALSLHQLRKQMRKNK